MRSGITVLALLGFLQVSLVSAQLPAAPTCPPNTTELYFTDWSVERSPYNATIGRSDNTNQGSSSTWQGGVNWWGPIWPGSDNIPPLGLKVSDLPVTTRLYWTIDTVTGKQ